MIYFYITTPIFFITAFICIISGLDYETSTEVVLFILGIVFTILGTLQAIVLDDWFHMHRIPSKVNYVRISMSYKQAMYNLSLDPDGHDTGKIGCIRYFHNLTCYCIFFNTILGYFRFWFTGIVKFIKKMKLENKKKRRSKEIDKEIEINHLLEYENIVRGIK